MPQKLKSPMIRKKIKQMIKMYYSKHNNRFNNKKKKKK